MGACAGKTNRPAVVTVKKSSNKNANPSLAEHQTAFEEYDEPQNSQENRPVSQQKTQNPQPPVQSTEPQGDPHPPQELQPQHIPQEKEKISPNRHRESERRSQGIEDVDEEEFANQFKKKENVQAQHQPKEVPVYHQQDMGFAMNLGGQVAHEHTEHKGNVHKEETKAYESKNKDKRMKDIINNPDDLEHSLSSPIKNSATVQKKDDDDFDAFNDKPTNQPQHQQRQSNLSNGSYGVFGEQNNKGTSNKIESASPMSGVLLNKVVEKEKPVEVLSPQKQEHKIESPEKKVKEESPMKMRESMEKKTESPEKVPMKRKSLEKMPWERTSAVREDENEIEFFDDELEAS